MGTFDVSGTNLRGPIQLHTVLDAKATHGRVGIDWLLLASASMPYFRSRTYSCVRVRPSLLAARDLLPLHSRTARWMVSRSTTFRSVAVAVGLVGAAAVSSER
jgi:hypothetical protein